MNCGRPVRIRLSIWDAITPPMELFSWQPPTASGLDAYLRMHGPRFGFPGVVPRSKPSKSLHVWHLCR